MNIYRHAFTAVCPNNGATISYRLEIEKLGVIMVEAIVKTVARLTHEPCFHEDLADRLHAALGGRQTVCAHHHGVDIETRRGRWPC